MIILSFVYIELWLENDCTHCSLFIAKCSSVVNSKHRCCRKEVVCNRDQLALGYLIFGESDNRTVVVTLSEKNVFFFSLNNQRNSTEQSTANNLLIMPLPLMSCLQHRRNL
jgi:hypothetical protein